MSDIIWPEGYLPGMTDNYVSNEIIVRGLQAKQVWPLVNRPALWPSYYGNAADIVFHDEAEPELRLGTRFRFTTFGFPVEAEVTEHEPPVAGKPGRIAWHGWVEGDAETRLDVHHAWLFEDLPGGRVRVLPRKPNAAGRPNSWRQPCPTPCSTPTRSGSRGWRAALGRPPRREWRTVP